MKITITADDDVEIRQITLINHSDQERHLRLVSYGELLLAPRNEPHPAFNKLFVESEYIADHNMLLFHRRPRAADEEPIYLGHMLITSTEDAITGTFDADRMRFLGRGMSVKAPASLQQHNGDLSQTVGVTLDPIMTLGQDIVIAPHARVRVAYLTVAARSREEAIALADRYHTWHMIARAFDSARRQNELLERPNSSAWLNQRGGIFTLNADQMSEADRILIQTTAGVVLDGQKGTLADQLAHLSDQVTALPTFTPIQFNTETVEATPPLARPTDLRFDNALGGFSDNGAQYVIYLEAGQSTPAPWVNVVANESFGFLVSESGAGYTWAEDSSQNKLTPWSNDPVTDAPGEELYVRDEETAQVWSPMPSPSRHPAR